MKYPTLNESTFSNEFDEITKVEKFKSIQVKESRMAIDAISAYKKNIAGIVRLIAHIYSDKTIVLYTDPSIIEASEINYISENYDLVLSNIKNKLYENH